MKELIEIHNTQTYQRMYECFTDIFIDSFSDYRRKGHDTQESLGAAKIKIQTRLVEELVLNQMDSETVVSAIEAYMNIKDDTRIIHKAIAYYQSMK